MACFDNPLPTSCPVEIKKFGSTFLHNKCAWKGISYLQLEGSLSPPMQQISFTSNSFQMFSLEYNFWPSHQHHSHMIRLIFIGWTYLPRILINLIIIDRGHSPRQPNNCKTSSKVSQAVILVGKSEIKFHFQWKHLKGIGCEWDLLHGLGSNYPQTVYKRNPFMHNCEGKCWLICFEPKRTWKLVRDYQSMQSLELLWLVFDTGLILTPLMGHLGNLSSHCSVPVCCGCERGLLLFYEMAS